MSPRRELRLNAFEMGAPGHTWAGLWRHPRDAATRYNTLDYWVSLARTAERGLFDGIFLADVVGVYDVYGASPATALARAAQAPNLDPFLLVPAMAHATTHLGFGVTANLTYEHPYTFTRRLSTLDHLTNGRIGWNVVTGYLESGARGMGLPQAREHDARYDAGEDFLEAAYKLWEGSWEDGAALRDRASGLFTQPAGSTASPMTGRATGSMGSISASRRRNGRPCSTRPAPRRADVSSPPAMPRASSSTARPRPSRARPCAPRGRRPRRRAAIPTTSECSSGPP